MDVVAVSGRYRLGSRIKELLAQSHMSQLDLSLKLRLHASVVSLWARDEYPVPLHHLESLAAVFGLTVAELTNGECSRVEIVPTPKGRNAAREFAEWIATEPEFRKGVDGLAEMPIYDVSCFMCGRGLGREGIRKDVHHLPIGGKCISTFIAWNCAVCGGAMFAERIPDRATERLMQQRVSYVEIAA